ncbi:MAG: RICIN domain-containing protein [Pseudanabaena sp. Salubria-1]|nr:RICIN domain-containing protein [Pseudanabaena sp. Salubria-1]
MHWVVVNGFSASEQKIYYTETADGKTYEYSYGEFQSNWDWRVGKGLASEALYKNGVEPKTMIWVDRVPPVVAQSQGTSSSRPVASLNLALDANNGTGNLYLYPNLDSTNNNHLWTITPLSDGYFMIISKRNGYALDANGGTKNLYLHPSPDTRNPNHYWRLTQVGGFYMITSRVNGYALDANGGTRNLYLHPNPDRGNSNHLWKIVDVGSYKAIGSALKN